MKLLLYLLTLEHESVRLSLGGGGRYAQPSYGASEVRVYPDDGRTREMARGWRLDRHKGANGAVSESAEGSRLRRDGLDKISVTRRRIMRSIGAAAIAAIPAWRILLTASPASATGGVVGGNYEECDCAYVVSEWCSPVTSTLWYEVDIFTCATFESCGTYFYNSGVPCTP